MCKFDYTHFIIYLYKIICGERTKDTWIEMWVWLGGGVIQSHRGLSLHYSSLLHLQMIRREKTVEPCHFSQIVTIFTATSNTPSSQKPTL